MSSLDLKDSAAPLDSVRDDVRSTGSTECFLVVFNMEMDDRRLRGGERLYGVLRSERYQ